MPNRRLTLLALSAALSCAPSRSVVESRSPGSTDACVEAEAGTASTERLRDGLDEAEVQMEQLSPCRRRYRLSSTAPLRDRQPANPRVVEEREDLPVVRTHNPLFDALYALALTEAREASVQRIRDGSFNDGGPIPCDCFETGRLWTYVWTRDTAYSVDLGLAAFDPSRARRSLEFKLSERRSGGDLQIVQDTGSGGSYPVSSDRVAWALGAAQALNYLGGSERVAFRDRAYEAVRNTIEHDRDVLFDAGDGLYRGEQSFLDWREQSYPPWTAENVVPIATSKALSTNVAHLGAIELAQQLAAEKGDGAAALRYRGWGAALREAIHRRLFLPELKQYATFIPGGLDPTPAQRFDLLGSALAVLHEVGTSETAREVVAHYPHLPRGAPVVWPSEPGVAVYHNRALWPFATAYWLKAARKVGNARAVDHGVASLIRGAALNLSNMENLEMVSGRPWLEDGALSGPVINSQRQLWSVAGYLAMVQDVLFGAEARAEGLRFVPFITGKMRATLFKEAERLVLSGFRYRGKRLDVVIRLPPAGTVTSAAYEVAEVRLDGKEVGSRFLSESSLGQRSTIEISLRAEARAPDSIRLLAILTDSHDPRLFAPAIPSLGKAESKPQGVELIFSKPPTASDSETSIDIYRDGVLAVSKLPGETRTWIDRTPERGGCYVARRHDDATGNTSHASMPVCTWAQDPTRVRTISRQDLTVDGDEVLTLPSFRPSRSGEHLLEVDAARAGPINTGVTCGVRHLSVEELPSGAKVFEGELVLPHTGDWKVFRASTPARFSLDAAKQYRIRLSRGPRSTNMSELRHFERYTGGLGGAAGADHRVDVRQWRIVALEGRP